MPQPALHILLGDATLRDWRRAGCGPFDPRDTRLRDAFLVGTLGPDFGLFPGGIPEVSAVAHTGRSADLLRSLLVLASSPAEEAFAWGWLTHVLADVAVHPLVNRAAAMAAAAEGRAPTLNDHIRVEVGLDAWFGWRHRRLRRVRLRPGLDRAGFGFVAAALRATHGCDVTPGQLLAMQRGMLRFTKLAIFFATSVARDLCWEDGDEDTPAPLSATLVWRAALALSARTSAVHAYLQPLQPEPWLVSAAAGALRGFARRVDAHIDAGVKDLPNYDLETGSLPRERRRVA